MREIAQAAGVAQSLIHYHYKDKDALYRAVFERRASAIRAARGQRLEQLFAEEDTPELESILEVMLNPLHELLDARGKDFRFYLQMVAEVTTSASPRSIDIMKTYYDPSAEIFLAALEKSMPTLPRDMAVWAYLFAIGARMQAHINSNRASRLGWSGAESPHGLLIPFVATGIRSLASGANAVVSVKNPNAAKKRRAIQPRRAR
ncbi:transcriptional regulator, TetR family [Paraburkholderia megapolitana]|uniref:Transcriptional regulator, TetR family n=2 Tax=Paraburkholderia megapolitana TaxID=420953 RepID=A0A1I3VWT3_9BURK|nr:transcriptional regulator, TetR family [Paraburkholderia megapolitana]